VTRLHPAWADTGPAWADTGPAWADTGPVQLSYLGNLGVLPSGMN
jgi:hypothetical protein